MKTINRGQAMMSTDDFEFKKEKTIFFSKKVRF